MIEIQEKHLPIIEEALRILVSQAPVNPKYFHKRYSENDVDEAFVLLMEYSPIRYNSHTYSKAEGKASLTELKAQLEGRFYERLLNEQAEQKRVSMLKESSLKWQRAGARWAILVGIAGVIIAVLSLIF